jgi:hypothetical protein
MRKVLGPVAGFYVVSTAAWTGRAHTGTYSIHVNDPDHDRGDSVIASGSVEDRPHSMGALDAAQAAGVKEVFRIVNLLVHHGGGWPGVTSLEAADCML